MNLQCLLEYIVQLTSASLRVYTLQKDGGLEPLCHYTAAPGPLEDVPPEVLAFLREAASQPLPSLACASHQLYYAVVPHTDTLYLLGPVCLSAPLALRRNLHCPDPAWETGGLCDIQVFLPTVLLLHNLLSDRQADIQELLTYNSADKSNLDVQKYYTSLIYENRENGEHHNAYSQETRLLDGIERGDLPIVEKCQREGLSGTLGTLSPNADRSARNVSISAITLASRAAIRGGVNPELAFSMCDSYIMKVEALRDLSGLQPLVEGAQLNFASMVQARQRGGQSDAAPLHHPLVEKSKNYIYTHLHGKVSVSEAARLLGTNPNYLSTLFKLHEGISFSAFVIREKISHAKNLLLYSKMSYAEIAATLGFSSQSHMGTYFKQQTGMTPIQFRRRFAVTEFRD